MWDRVTAIATWIGHASALAGHFPIPGVAPGSTGRHARDTEAQRSAVSRRTRKQKKERSVPAHLFATPQLEGLRARVAAKAHAPSSAAGCLATPAVTVSVAGLAGTPRSRPCLRRACWLAGASRACSTNTEITVRNKRHQHCILCETLRRHAASSSRCRHSKALVFGSRHSQALSVPSVSRRDRCRP